MELPAEDETLLFTGTPDGTIVQLRNALQRHERRIMDNAGRAASTSRATSTRTTTSGRQPARTGAAGSSVNSSTRCQNCRRTGHAAENCPHPKRPADACYRCWKSGHRLQSCPNESVFRTQRFPASVVAAVIDETAESGENGDDTVQPVNKVGIVFTTRGFNQNEHSRLMNSLFDTGSPKLASSASRRCPRSASQPPASYRCAEWGTERSSLWERSPPE
ncbi:PREDICTED: uncharacterized protein LOC105558497 [Vollenhovia emeryi]|uniref:uncharacterized protein LOC105558497 n=1 Tax=Vollenhovia emeryi TaxID=411798 RepID=UPI0005F52BC6|nr:PREDICTED: uncharacterized protein LOC105558497 [Vollenhovia emeryi]